jgi:3-methylcrotonyl-CoA carboxylase alpha subunit
VLIEKYVLNPRHIEVQVFGDMHGNVVHLFERDCSLQRRHQKVIEEAPAPGMDEATRAAICGAAVKAARAVDYVGAGTIEFIADASEGLRADRIWFMEMNTRLQVEHPVTEEITGEDLVEWQLRVASGEPLPRRQDELVIDGWAVEARIYAEDPARNFLPSIGPIDYLSLPDTIRVESGVEEGDRITSYYDPMIAKLIARADTREAAIEKLAEACREVCCEPISTNAWFLARLLDSEPFRSATMTTNSIAELGEALVAMPQPSDRLLQAAADQAATHDAFVRGRVGDPDYDRFAGLHGFRLNADRDLRVWIDVNSEERLVEYDHSAVQAYWQSHGGWTQLGLETVLFENGAAFVTAPHRARAASEAAASGGAVTAPMPGRVVSVDVTEGASVKAGQRLAVLEAMKMEQVLVAPFDGRVAELKAAVGAQVSEGALLVRIEKHEA